MHRLGGVVLDVADQPGDFLRSALRLLGELADLLGDHGEATTLFAGAGGLDRRIERQQIRLRGNPGDRLDDRADVLALLGQLANRARHRVGRAPDVGHRRARLLGGGYTLPHDLAGLFGDLGRHLGLLGAALHRGRHLLDRGTDRVDHLDLPLGALGDVGNRAGDLVRRPAGLGRVRGHVVRRAVNRSGRR